MKRFLLSHSCISACLTFYLICSVLVHHWTTAYIPWINTFVWIAAQSSYLLIAIFIGIHLQQLLARQNSRVVLTYLVIGYFLFQLISYPLQHPISFPIHWPTFFNPKAFGLVLGATLIAASGITLSKFNLKRKQQWKAFILALGLLLAMLFLVVFYKSYLLVSLALAVTVGFLISENVIRSNSFLSAMSVSPKLRLYSSLVFVSVIIHWFPPLFKTIGLAYQYLACFFISAAILLLTATPPFSSFSRWINNWLYWISSRSTVNVTDSLFNFYFSLNTFWQQSVAQSAFFNNLLSTSLYVLRIASITTIAFLIIELPIRNWSINALFTWVSSSTFFITLTYSVIFICYCIFRIFLSWRAAAAVLFIVTIIISAISTMKVRYLGIPLIPSDLNLINQSLDSLVFIIGKPKTYLVFALLSLALILFALALWCFSKLLLNQNMWVSLRGISLLLFALWLAQPENFALNERSPNAWEIRNSLGLYQKIGFVTGFWVSYQQFFIQKPEGFSKYSIKNLSNKVNIATENTSTGYRHAGYFPKPHIIAIQSEAFWDPGLLHNDLYPFGSPGDLSVLCLNSNNYCKTGYVEVPVFGGGTANSEYEFLTGLSMSLLPSGTAPFVHYIQSPVASIGWRLQQANYQTLGIHPNVGWFWNRDKVYPLLGFQEFMDIDAFDQAEKEQFYVSDQAITKMIKARIEQAHQPQFIFAVTMANHAPFVDQRYSAFPDELINWEQLPILDPEEQLAIKTYSIGVRESRAALKELVDTYSKEDAPPVIIVFYGDHLPILGENYSIYYKSGFKMIDLVDPFKELYSTPYFVWSNQAISHTLTENMPVSLLGQEIMEMAGLGKSGLQQLISQLQNTYFLSKPPRDHMLRGQLPAELTEQQLLAIELYRHANFDALFHQHTPAFFGLVSPTTKKPVADLDVDQ